MSPRGAAALVSALLVSCRSSSSSDAVAPTASAEASASAFAPKELPPAPPKGMVWVPAGILLAGTPEDRTPRIADAEMPGAQVPMKAFFVDELPYPNEPGAIPLTGVTQPRAAELCAAQGKRLCTELEWERACKGPQNFTYPYGNRYRPNECDTGSPSAAVPPVGVLVGCKSGFGMRDSHGGVFQWTASPWGRGTVGNLSTLRGGDAEAGEVVSRCANAIGRRPTEARRDYGFRCCSGDANLAEVTLDIVRGESLRAISPDEAMQRALADSPPKGLVDALAAGGGGAFKVLTTWRWRPIGNEELLLQSGCAHPGQHAVCGIAVGRPKAGKLESLGFVSSSWWLPTLHEDTDPRDLWVFGGDELGGYRRKLQYAWGRVIIGDAEHKVAEADRKRKRKRERD